MAHYLMQFFTYEHLPARLRTASQPFAALAELVDGNLRDNPEKTTCLRKLLEAKDCAVRAVLFEAGAPDPPRAA
jgi:hypothetical protein